MNTRYSTDVEYGFTTLYTPNYGICHNICGTLNISFVVDRGSGVPDRHHNTGKRPEFTWIPVHSRITAFHWFMRIKTLLRKKRKAPDPGGNPGARTIAYRTQGPAPGQYRLRQGSPESPLPPTRAATPTGIVAGASIYQTPLSAEPFLPRPANYSLCGSFGPPRSHGHTNWRSGPSSKRDGRWRPRTTKQRSSARNLRSTWSRRRASRW